MVLPSPEVAILTKQTTRKAVTQTHNSISPQPASNLGYCYLSIYLFNQHILFVELRSVIPYLKMLAPAFIL
jgi:hypothetical protein